MSVPGKTLQIRHAPHISGTISVEGIMRNVLLATLPVCAFAVYAFGLAALLTLLTAVLSCVLTEFVLCRLNHRATTVGDGSVAVTGILYGLTLPPTLPLWMTAIGGVLAVGVGKFLFGGLGANPFNPALVGRALLQAAFPVAMTSWSGHRAAEFTVLPSSTLTPPLLSPQYDAVSSATPLSGWKFEQTAPAAGDLFFGTISGSTGETCAALILLGGIYLVWRRMMSWQIPATILLTVAVFSGILWLIDSERYASPLFMMFSGGLVLGAVFMATDPVGSPMTTTGEVIYGALIGIVVVVIRAWGGLPEGVMYAILLGNALTPHIDHLVQPQAFGTGRQPHV